MPRNYTNGKSDKALIGHAKAQCDKLIVAVGTDL